MKTNLTIALLFSLLISSNVSFAKIIGCKKESIFSILNNEESELEGSNKLNCGKKYTVEITGLDQSSASEGIIINCPLQTKIKGNYVGAKVGGGIISMGSVAGLYTGDGYCFMLSNSESGEKFISFGEMIIRKKKIIKIKDLSFRNRLSE